jgi:protein-glutamine gamma-glutamyltransferase
MTFTQYFKASSYCLIASGFIAISATGSLDWASLTLFTLILAGSWFLDTARIRQRIPKWILNCVILAYLPFFALDYKWLSGSLMIALIHLILFAASIKLLTLTNDSDYFILYLISFAELLSASTLTMNIAFGICFLIFLISGVSALILFEMSRSNAHVRNHAIVQPLIVSKNLQGTPWELFSPFPAGLLCATTLGITLLILAIAIPVFFLLPRITSATQLPVSGKARLISGFSDRVELGRSGVISRSDAVVMRIKISDSDSGYPVDLKWRGLVFDYYDGRSWKRTDLRKSQTSKQGQFFKLENSAQGTNLLFQTFFMEALSTEVIFAANKALAVSQEVGLLQKDSAGSLYAARPAFTKLRYSAISDLSRPDPKDIHDSDPIPSDILSVYLQLPSFDPRITTMARQAAAKAAGGKYGQALALECYLRSHYEYSLNLPKIPGDKDPLSFFLFDAKKGHCEYFASALVVMLRSLGIPARLINGFRSGEYNRIGDHWIVRQYNAHSWAEAYFPSYGWIEFDPTPSETRVPQSMLARVFSDLTDTVDLWWWDSVLDYDLFKQYRILGGVRDGMERFQRRTANDLGFLLNAIREHGAWNNISVKNWIILFLAASVILILLHKTWRRRTLHWLHRTMRRENNSQAAHGFYMDALRLLHEEGMSRNQGQTPLEFARSLESHPAAAPFLALTQLYNAARFGPPGIALNVSEAAAHLRLLRASLRK